MSKHMKGLLECMVEVRSMKEIQELLETGADVNCTDEFYNTPLHYCNLYMSDPSLCYSIVKLLLEYGANPNALNDFYKTPLMMLIQKSCTVEIISLLIQRGADVNYADCKDHTALSYCTQNMFGSDIEIAKLLIMNNADVNVRNYFRETPLMCLIKSQCSVSVIEMVLNAGAKVHYTDIFLNTALHYCSKYDEKDGMDIIRLLIKMNANVNATNSHIETVLMRFIKSRRSVQMIQLLIEAGANLNSCDVYGDTALHFSSRYEDLMSVGIVRLLLEHGASVNATNRNMETPLVKFIQHRHSTDTIRLLLNKGADINCRDMHRKTALHYCAEYDENECFDIVKLLLENKAETDVTDDCLRTPLMELIAHDRGFDVIKLLIDSGADIHCRDFEGNSALHFCSICITDHRLFRLLIDNGADVNIHNNLRSTPLRTCLYKRSINLDIIKLLLNASLPCTDLLNNLDLNIFMIRGDSFVHILFKYLLLVNDNIWLENYEILKAHFRNFREIENKMSFLIRELDRLKRFTIKDGLSLYDFCIVNNRKKLGLYLKNSNLFTLDLKPLFPEYFDLIKFKMTAADEWCTISNKLECITLATKSQPDVPTVTLNFHCFLHLASNFLNKSDLLCLIAASESKHS